MKCYNFCNPDQGLEYNAPSVLILRLNLKVFTTVGYVVLTLIGTVLSYFLTPYMAIPVFIICIVLFFKEVHFDTHKAFEKYLLK